MTKQELLKDFTQNHLQIIHYIDHLPSQKFNYHSPGKWTTGQPLQHILLTITPFPKVLASKVVIREKFGEINRPTWDYSTVLENYLNTSLKAPEPFLPETEVSYSQKEKIISDIHENLNQIQQIVDTYSEEELDTLTLPHPLLGLVTIREMFYLMSYHPLHHQKQIEQLLNQDANNNGK